MLLLYYYPRTVLLKMDKYISSGTYNDNWIIFSGENFVAIPGFGNRYG